MINTPITLKESRISAKAVLLGPRISLKSVPRENEIAAYPLTLKVSETGFAVLFRYGAVVMFGLSQAEEEEFLKEVLSHVPDIYETREEETEPIHLSKTAKKDSINPNNITLCEWSIEKFQLIADILSKNIVLSKYENSIAATFDKIEPLAIDIEAKGTLSRKKTRELLQHIGTNLRVQRTIVGHVEIHDKPDLVWDNPDLERFYARLEDDYEIKERHDALKQKLDLVFHTAETLMGLLHSKQSLRVEWYITLLIVFDIVLHLSEKYFGL